MRRPRKNHMFAYLLPRPDPRPRVPRRLIEQRDMSQISLDERVLMKMRIARSPQDARRLIRKFGTLEAVIAAHPKRRRNLWKLFTRRLQLAIWRWAGHDPRKPVTVQHVPIRYKWK